MFIQKSIAVGIILIFTFIYESHGLKCYEGVKLLKNDEEVDRTELTECSEDSDVCTKTELISQGMKALTFACRSITETEKAYVNSKECFNNDISEILSNHFGQQMPEHKTNANVCYCDDADGCNSSTSISSNILLSVLSFLLCFYLFK